MLFHSKLGLNANEHPDSLPTRDTGGVSGEKKLAKQLWAYHSVLQLQSRNTEERETGPTDIHVSKSIRC